VLPVSGLVHVGPQIAADRYTYLPCLGLALLAGGAYIRSRMALRGHGTSGGLLDVAAGTLPVLLLVLTMGQITVWRDSETLWSHALAVSPSAIAHAKLGIVRDEQGRTEEAIAHYRAALALHPDMPDAYNDWGIALARQGRWDDAVEQYRKALVLQPGSVEARLNLAAALERLGKSGEAAEHAREAQRIQTKGR
jgi:tetratricopeptide (TPR) repeat protein